jgi:hypothetical protein
MDVADGPGMSRALHRVKRIGGIARDIVVPRLPDSVFSLCFHNVWLKNEHNCARPSFARAHRQAVEAMRGPAFRLRPGIRATICHLLEYGHLVKRLEHWATSGARHRLVYRYPALDRRLVEFALGIPTIQHCRTETHLPIFRRSVAALIPVTCDWDQRKEESVTLSALKKAWFSAHEEWARRLGNGVGSAPARFVELELISMAVQAGAKTGKMSALSGVREAFACYSLEKSTPHL